MGLGLLAAVRLVASYLTTSKKVMTVFLGTSVLVAALTFHGTLSILSCLGSMFGTIGSFCKEDKQMRQVLLIATSLWLIHNWLAGSPTAVLMEALFIGSNLLGYYRYYYRRAGKPEVPPSERDGTKDGAG